MKKERKVIPLGRILLNEGQLDWLPRNPRQWTQTDIDRTAASIREDPDFLEDRPILVVPYENGFFIAFAGNLRQEGSVAAKRADVPCVVYHPQTEEDFETVKRRAMKDNGSFGSWDYDALANEWSDLPLGDWGVSKWESDKPGEGGIDIDGLFNPEASAPTKEKPLELVIVIPKEQAEMKDQIRAQIETALDIFPGVTIKE